MVLIKMKKTPTGWGTGYTNIDHIRCERISSTKLKCTLKPYAGKDVDFVGSDVFFKNIQSVSISPRAVIATDFGMGKLLACYVDSGVITCLPEKELK